MDKCGTDAEFDSYWDNEAKNQNRNRIRVGRQYQATIPPLLKPGQKDGRKSEELETLKWRPDQLSDQAIEEYLSMAKGLGLFSKSLDSPKPSEKSDNSLQSAIKGLSEFVTSHHPCHHDDGCKVPQPSSSGESSSSKSTPDDWSPSEAQLFAQALETCGKNFGAIKKEYLPWKPIKSIIEYYYEGKGEKTEELLETCVSAELSPKKEKSPSPSCSKDEKLSVKEEPLPDDAKEESPPLGEDPPKDSVNFLENTRVTDPCKATPPPDVKVTANEEFVASSNLGSLKFFLGGRLVLKLNAQQDSGSGTKCQWVQSNDVPKHPNSIKKERQRKKFTQEGSFTPNIEPQRPNNSKKTNDQHKATNDCDPSAMKKPRLKSEYDFAENDSKHGMLLCSSYWTPPVADGQEAMIEVDDCSSKTSEGYISPVLTNSRFPKSENYNDSASVSPIHTNSRLPRTEIDKTDSRFSNENASPIHTNSRFSRSELPNDSATMSPINSNSRFPNDNASSSPIHNSRFPRSENFDSASVSPIHTNSRFTKSELGNDKTDSRFPNDRSSPIHTNSRFPRSEHLNDRTREGYASPVIFSSRLTKVDHSELAEEFRLSENDIASKNILGASRSPYKQEVLNHKSALSHNRTSAKSVCYQPQASHSSGALLKQWNKWPSAAHSKRTSSPVSTMDLMSPLKENPLDLSSRLDNTSSDPIQSPHKTALSSNPDECESPRGGSCSPQSSNLDSPHKCPEGGNDPSCCEGNSSDCKEDEPCSPCCQLPYRCALPKCTKDSSSLEEVPLDLSSANESLKEKTADSEKLSENANVTENSAAAAVEKGMLYQLLKSKTSK